jgi:hypothetical protein
MSRILYFIPGQAAAGTTILQKAGLAGVIGPQRSTRGPTAGPADVSGVLVANNPPPGSNGSTGPAELSYSPEAQRWAREPEGRYYVGVGIDNPPGPADLIREDAPGGNLVTLADGRDWMVPVVATFANSPQAVSIPRAIVFDDTGQLVTEPKAELQILEEVGAEIFEALALTDDGVFELPNRTQEELIRIAFSALSVNYHLGAAEVSLLRLVDTDNYQKILLELADYAGLLAMIRSETEAKKNSGPTPPPDGSSTTSGGPDTAPADLTPPTPISSSSRETSATLT